MPKRSNEFQRLIHDIHHQLHGSATVRESAFLADQTGGPPLEVDIVIEDVSGEYPFVIGVECIDHKRPADIGWVLQMGAKHSGRTDKLVLVSRSGFSKNALEEASRCRIVTLELKDALQVDWAVALTQIKALTIGMFHFKVEQGYLVLDQTDERCVHKIGPQQRFYEADGRALNTADELARYVVNHPDVATYLMDQIRARPDLKWARFETPMNREVVVEDTAARKHVVRAVRLDVSWTTGFTPLEVKTNALGNVQVAWGSTKLDSQDLLFVATGRDGGESRATLRIRPEGSKEAALLDLVPYPETPTKFKVVEVTEDELN